MDKEEISVLKGVAIKMGTWVFISWILVLGLAGFGLFCLLTFSMHFSNVALGVVCVLLLASPLFFICAWVPLLVASLLAEKRIGRELIVESFEAVEEKRRPVIVEGR